MASGNRHLAVLTHHKCASRFVGLYLTRFCELNGLKFFCSHRGDASPRVDHDVSLLANAGYGRVAAATDCSLLHIIRNPLDIIVSAYYSHLSTHTLDGWPQLHQQRRILMDCDKNAGLFLTLAFLEAGEFYTATPGPLHDLRQWRFDDKRIITVRMEDLVVDLQSVMQPHLRSHFGRAVRLPDPDGFSFESLTGGRHIGQVDNSSHYRSGMPGEWRRELPPAIVRYVQHHFAHVLERHYPECSLHSGRQWMWRIRRSLRAYRRRSAPASAVGMPGATLPSGD